MRRDGGTPAVIALGVTQTIGYASSAYLLGVTARPMAQSVGCPVSVIYLAFSAALLLQVFLGPLVGRYVDERGGRAMLLGGSAAFILGLAGLAVSTEAWQLFLGWLVIGIGMEIGLYDTAFAVLVRLRGSRAKGAITGVTLIAGFASTIGWPLTTWLTDGWGWRTACLVWAAANLMICVPVHVWLPRGRRRPVGAVAPEAGGVVRAGRRTFVLVAIAFATATAVNASMIAHLPALLTALGASAPVALLASALVGPAQVAARLADHLVVGRVHPVEAMRGSAAAFPAGAVLLLVLGPVAAPVLAVLYGAGNGAFSILRGAVPLALFGPAGFGHRLGRLMIASRLVQAAAPVSFALAMSWSARTALWSLAGIACLGVASMSLVRVRV